jgi:hypothetical protein
LLASNSIDAGGGEKLPDTARCQSLGIGVERRVLLALAEHVSGPQLELGTEFAQVRFSVFVECV